MRLRLEAPAPGYALLHAYDPGEGTILTIQGYLFGPGAAEIAAREEPAWRRFIERRFPKKAD